MTLQNVAYLSGGVGGARLLDGLARVLPAEALSAIVNTGDDLTHWGLRVCPDIDTVLYTLSGLGDAKRGWGLRNESFHALENIARFGGEQWFQLGDRDLATHLVRSERLRRGETLTAVTAALASALGIGCAVLPMCDEPRETRIVTEHEGTLGFQHWLVRRRGEPRVRAVEFHETERAARVTPQVLAVLARAELVVIGPSNPYVSVDPILTLPGLRAALAGKRVVALSPIVGGKAVKGPLAEMIPALAGRPASAAAIAAHYAPMLTGMVVEHGDGVELGALPVLQTRTIMHGRRERARLARELLAFAAELPQP